MIVRLFCIAALAISVAACSSTAHCRKEQDYQKAASIDPLNGTGELKIPESATALRIPPPPETSVAFGEKFLDKDGDEKWSCLDVPPKLEVPEEREEPKPVS